jgi:hypothetical protein
VSTNASHLKPLDKSEALSILTEATILPIAVQLYTPGSTPSELEA